jgi:hypothetical protein
MASVSVNTCGSDKARRILFHSTCGAPTRSEILTSYWTTNVLSLLSRILENGAEMAWWAAGLLTTRPRSPAIPGSTVGSSTSHFPTREYQFRQLDHYERDRWEGVVLTVAECFTAGACLFGCFWGTPSSWPITGKLLDKVTYHRGWLWATNTSGMPVSDRDVVQLRVRDMNSR